MGVKFGEIDVTQILDNEFRVKFVAGLVQWIFDNNPQLKKPNHEEIKLLQEAVVKELQKKYPNSGLKLEQ
ncbi:MAG: hypothetical protein ACD_22C00166G0015 [uncultured bacterium]|nr:MAG: hypothetical protein ACD_22C00166G0015 [uncultured bacterium]